MKLLDGLVLTAAVLALAITVLHSNYHSPMSRGIICAEKGRITLMAKVDDIIVDGNALVVIAKGDKQLYLKSADEMCITVNELPAETNTPVGKEGTDVGTKEEG